VTESIERAEIERGDIDSLRRREKKKEDNRRNNRKRRLKFNPTNQWEMSSDASQLQLQCFCFEGERLA